MNIQEIWDIKEVSKYLKIPISTVYRLTQSGKIPAVKVGKHWRFRKKDIDRIFIEYLGNLLMSEGKV